MENYGYLFATTLHQKLKEKIVGKVFTKVTNDDKLIVKIESFGDVKYSMTLNNFSERILNGWSTDYATYDVLKQYKAFVMNRYFR